MVVEEYLNGHWFYTSTAPPPKDAYAAKASSLKTYKFVDTISPHHGCYIHTAIDEQLSYSLCMQKIPYTGTWKRHVYLQPTSFQQTDFLKQLESFGQVLGHFLFAGQSQQPLPHRLHGRHWARKANKLIIVRIHVHMSSLSILHIESCSMIRWYFHSYMSIIKKPNKLTTRDKSALTKTILTQKQQIIIIKCEGR